MPRRSPRHVSTSRRNIQQNAAVTQLLGCSVARFPGAAATQEPSNSATMILVTGAAGFIGYHVAKRLLERGDSVVGFDLVNDYYDPRLKEARLRLLEST